jgi:transcriptional/translational regulatory protein YebC/TACO1
MKERLGEAGLKLKSFELSMKPKNIIEIKEQQQAARVLNFMNNLQEHDDVQKVFANFDIPDEVLKQIEK